MSKSYKSPILVESWGRPYSVDTNEIINIKQVSFGSA